MNKWNRLILIVAVALFLVFGYLWCKSNSLARRRYTSDIGRRGLQSVIFTKLCINENKAIDVDLIGTEIGLGVTPDEFGELETSAFPYLFSINFKSYILLKKDNGIIAVKAIVDSATNKHPTYVVLSYKRITDMKDLYGSAAVQQKSIQEE